MKILFVNPRHPEWAKALPLGIAYLAAVLKDEGYKQIKAIDANAENLNDAQTLKRIANFSPDIVLATAVTAQIFNAWRILEQVKKMNPKIVTVLGGVHPTALPEESLQENFLDFLVRGEGEQTIIELIKAIESNKGYDKILGLSYRIDSRIVHNPKRPLKQNLDEIPFPARELFAFPQGYSSPFVVKKRFATLITSRGCPGRCIFCNKNISGFEFRPRSPQNVIAEIKELNKKFQIEEFHMADDCFSWDTNRVSEICKEIINEGLNIRWACSNGIRVDTVTEDLLYQMKEAGCYRISFGVESGLDEILKKIGKGINLAQIKEVFNLAQKIGIITVALFMLGNFGEDKKTMDETIKFAKSLNTDYAQFTIAVPFPGTIFYQLIEKNGHFLTRDWSRFGVFDEPVFEANGLSKELMKKMYKKAYREFYFRPKQIFFMLKKRIRYLSWQDFRNTANSVKETLARMGTK